MEYKKKWLQCKRIQKHLHFKQTRNTMAFKGVHRLIDDKFKKLDPRRAELAGKNEAGPLDGIFVLPFNSFQIQYTCTIRPK